MAPEPVEPSPNDPASPSAVRSAARGGDPIHHVPIAAMTIDADGIVCAANQRFASLLDLPLDIVVGAALWDLVAPGQKSRVLDELGRRREGFELDVRRADGKTMTFEVVGLSMESGRTTMWLSLKMGSDVDRVLRRQSSLLLDLAKLEAVDAGDRALALRHLTEAAAEGLRCARASVWLFDAARTALELVDLYRPEDRSHTRGGTLHAVDYPRFFGALAEDRAIAAEDCRTHAATSEFAARYLIPLGVTAILAAPIRRGGELIGLLCIGHCGGTRWFTQEEQNFAANLADYVTRALEASERRRASEALADAHLVLASRAQDLEAQIAARTQALQVVLDSTGDALLSCGLDGVLAPGASATARAWFGERRPGTSAADYLFVDPTARSLFALGLEQLIDDFLPFETIVDQMPQFVQREGRTFSIRYRPILDGEKLTRLLLVVREATAEFAVERAEREGRELTAVAGQILKDRAAFFGFLEECHLLVLLLEDERDVAEARRTVHTLKGNAAVYGLEGLAEAAHRAEDMLAVTPERLPDAVALTSAALHEATARLSAIFGAAAPEQTVHASESEYEAFLEALAEAQVPRPLLATAKAFRAVPMRTLLERLARQVERVALRAEKDVVVAIEDPGLRLSRSDLGPFFTTLVHVVRNAVDHGIEATDERTAQGKPAHGQITLRVASTEDAFSLTIEDDGRGIAWERVREKAERLGLPCATKSDLEDVLFHDGFTTRDEVTDLSGRGVGLGAVREAAKSADGAMTIETTPGRGTQFRFTFAHER